MKFTLLLLRTAALSTLFAAALAQAATVSGTVTDKTTGKPAAGDPVVLVDVQAGMAEAAKTTTDARGHYSLTLPGASPYLIRVTHQGAGYFIAAPQGGGQGDIPVYDVAAQVHGVSIEADVLEAETQADRLSVVQRWFVHNTSQPPVTQWSRHSFHIVLPADAQIDSAQAQRPTGLPTGVQLEPDGPKGHYAFNFPIQPDEGEKDTLLLVNYTVPYSGKASFKAQVSLPTQNVAVLLPMGMSFSQGSASDFKPVKEDPGIQTFLARNVDPGKVLEYTISGTGSLPREAQGQQADGGQQAAAGTPTPGGGIGAPINTPDPLSKYKWWILGGLGLVLVAGAAVLLRQPAVSPALATVAAPAAVHQATALEPTFPIAPASGQHNALLNALKEELFTLESDKIAGKVDDKQYAEVKAALEVVLKRALNRNAG